MHNTSIGMVLQAIYIQLLEFYQRKSVQPHACLFDKERPVRLNQHSPHLDDNGIGRAQLFLRAIVAPAHGFLNDEVLESKVLGQILQAPPARH